MNNRRIIIATGFVLFFAVVVIVWYFFYAKPIIAPTLTKTNNPVSKIDIPPRFQFLNWWNDSPGTTTTEVTNPLEKPLLQVWNKPATGQTFVVDQILKEETSTTTIGTSTNITTIKKTVRATSTILIFVDRITGYVYGYPTETGKIFQISNTLLPGIYDAYFFNNSKRVIMRYIDQDKNSVVGLIATVPNVHEDGTALPLQNIQYLPGTVSSVVIHGKKDKASYLVTTEKGSSIYSISLKDPAFISSSPFREWDLSYGGDSLFVTSKPSAYVEGSTFKIPSFQSEITGKTGLMSNPNDFGVILNSMWGTKGLITFFEENGVNTILPITTLASKCTWGDIKYIVCAVPKTIPRGSEGLPDDWFQGRVSFDDDLVLVDKNTNEKYQLYTFNKEDGVFDITGIIMTKVDDLFSFNRKQDGTLWLLNTKLIQAE